MSALVPVYGKNDEVVAHAVVDDEDFEMVSQYRWCLGTKGYAIRNLYLGGGRASRRSTTIRMHRQILGLETGDSRQGDHRNGDVLDNRRSNLRIVTGAQNAQNRRKKMSATSPYRGVVHKGPRYKTKPWEAVVRHNGKRYYLGLFSTPEEANEACIAKRREILPFSEEVPSFQH